MTQLELKLANSNSGSCKTTWSTILIVFLTAPVKQVFFRSVLMMNHTTHARMTDISFVSPRLSILVLSN